MVVTFYCSLYKLLKVDSAESESGVKSEELCRPPSSAFRIQKEDQFGPQRHNSPLIAAHKSDVN